MSVFIACLYLLYPSTSSEQTVVPIPSGYKYLESGSVHCIIWTVKDKATSASGYDLMLSPYAELQYCSCFHPVNNNTTDAISSDFLISWRHSRSTLLHVACDLLIAFFICIILTFYVHFTFAIVNSIHIKDLRVANLLSQLPRHRVTDISAVERVSINYIITMD